LKNKKKKSVVKYCVRGHYSTEDEIKEDERRFCSKCGRKLKVRKKESNNQGHNRPKTTVMCR